MPLIKPIHAVQKDIPCMQYRKIYHACSTDRYTMHAVQKDMESLQMQPFTDL